MAQNNIPKQAVTISELRDPDFAIKRFDGKQKQILNKLIYGTETPNLWDKIKSWITLRF